MKRLLMKGLVLLAALMVFASGCAVQRVQPWERDILAQQKMQLVPDAMQNALDEHIYFSKEASCGGESAGGGGCGCN